MLAAGFEEFVTVVEHQSVTKAAEVLGLPRPTVSKRLARLEERLGVRLLHRSTRRMKLSQEGELLYQRASGIVHAARAAESAVRRLDGIPRGLLRVLVPPQVPEGVFSRWLAEFQAAHPEVQLDVVATAAHVDLVAEGFDVAMRHGELSDPSLIKRTLVVNQEIAVASPAYLQARGTPKHPEELDTHDCILGYHPSGVPQRHWPRLDGGLVGVSGKFTTDHHGLRVEAAKLGLGIAMVIDHAVREALAKGELVWVLPKGIGRKDQVRLVYADREFIDPKVRAFVDFFAERVRRGGSAPAGAAARPEP